MQVNWPLIAADIASVTHRPFCVQNVSPVSGGCINTAYVISGEGQQYFIKLNTCRATDMFSAESKGLVELANAAAIKVPKPICWGAFDDGSYLVMAYIALSDGHHLSAKKLGEQLAALHRVTAPEFGFTHDSQIGSTPQMNNQNKSWVAFYREQRLQYQLNLAKSKSCSKALLTVGNQLCENIEAFYSSYTPSPSLLHGDLWSGNYGYDEQGVPVIFDPAVYYGDREADIAMTELFGGFPREFYEAYQESYPLDEGYLMRKDLYNLYHVLNHFNLFGGGYEQQAVSMIKKLLSEVI